MCASLKVRRWKRFGHDRLYVDATDGTSVGWLSLTTGDLKLTGGATRDELIVALWANELAWPWLSAAARKDENAAAEGLSSCDAADQPTHVGAQPSERVSVAVRGESSVASSDLANNQPGAGVRARAKKEDEESWRRAPVATPLLRFVGANTEERSWRVGAAGEELIGVRLERLHRDGWQMLHSITVGKGDADIDHVLIGPGGVFTINTKNRPGKRIWVAGNTVLVNGQYVPYVRNARFEAQRAGRKLSKSLGRGVEVRPVLVLLTGSIVPDVTIRQQPADVLVLDRMDVPRRFRRMTRCLDEADVEAIFEVARRPGTWH